MPAAVGSRVAAKASHSIKMASILRRMKSERRKIRFLFKTGNPSEIAAAQNIPPANGQVSTEMSEKHAQD
jgi:hypothetical protein